MNDNGLLDHLYRLSGDAGFLREVLSTLTQLVMEMDVSAAIEASPYERKDGRRSYRNGYRERNWQTGLGEISLRIPKLRKGTYYPNFIEDWPAVEQAMLTLIEEALIQGIRPSSVEKVLKSIGVTPAHNSQIAELCDRLDEMIDTFRERSLDDSFPAVMVDVLPTRGDGRRADVVVVVGVRENGQREVLDFEVTPYAEGRNFWADFLTGLRRRGLHNIERIVSAPYEGLRPALREALPGANWIERSERQPMVAAYAPALVGSPGLWIDASVPNKNNQIVSHLGGLSTGIYGMPSTYAGFDQDDLTALRRIVGLLLMSANTVWQPGLTAVIG